MIKIEIGFLPALGTPLDANGNLVVESFKKQIEDQIAAGAVGLLCMGSMGQMAAIRQDVYAEVARAAVETAAGRVPVLVGAMDCSVERAKDRIKMLEGINVDGIVFTAPYYAAVSPKQAMRFFESVCDATDKNVFVYDLPSVTQSKITYSMVLELLAKKKNFSGIKSADTQMFRRLKLNPSVPEEFATVYSGLDTFDVVYKWGIEHCLDGMLTCTPKNTGIMFSAMKDGDYETAAKCLSNIIELRDLFVASDLWPAYSYTMNLLGYDGNFAPDYCGTVDKDKKNALREKLSKIGEL